MKSESIKNIIQNIIIILTLLIILIINDTKITLIGNILAFIRS